VPHGYSADSTDDGLGGGEVTDGSEVEFRDGVEDDNSTQPHSALMRSLSPCLRKKKRIAWTASLIKS